MSSYALSIKFSGFMFVILGVYVENTTLISIDQTRNASWESWNPNYFLNNTIWLYNNFREWKMKAKVGTVGSLLSIKVSACILKMLTFILWVMKKSLWYLGCEIRSVHFRKIALVIGYSLNIFRRLRFLRYPSYGTINKTFNFNLFIQFLYFRIM